MNSAYLQPIHQYGHDRPPEGDDIAHTGTGNVQPAGKCLLSRGMCACIERVLFTIPGSISNPQ